MRIVPSQEERWVVKVAGWNPEFSMQYKTNRAMGKTKKKMGR